MATKDELVRGIEILIAEGRRLGTDLTDAQWETVVDLDGWKNREVLAHVAGIGAVVVPMVQGLSATPAGADAMAAVNIDQMNAGIVAANAGKSASALADELAKNYGAVIDFIRSAPDATLAAHATAGGYRDIPISDLLMRMVVLHGLGHIYSVYSSIFFSKS